MIRLDFLSNVFIIIVFCNVYSLSGLNILVNSAGILVTGPTATLKWDDYDRCMDINTKAAFVLTQASIPHLLKTKGNIVHVSSVTGECETIHSV